MLFSFYAFVTFLLRESSSCSRFQAYNPDHRVIHFRPYLLDQLLWRNWLARSAVNREVGGSSPPRIECLFNFYAFVTILLRENSRSRFQAYDPGRCAL